MNRTSSFKLGCVLLIQNSVYPALGVYPPQQTKEGVREGLSFAGNLLAIRLCRFQKYLANFVATYVFECSITASKGISATSTF